MTDTDCEVKNGVSGNTLIGKDSQTKILVVGTGDGETSAVIGLTLPWWTEQQIKIIPIGYSNRFKETNPADSSKYRSIEYLGVSGGILSFKICYSPETTNKEVIVYAIIIVVAIIILLLARRR